MNAPRLALVALLAAVAGSVSVRADDAVVLLLGSDDIRPGLLVQVGCPDGRLTAALDCSGKFTVQVIDADHRRIAEARKAIQAAGKYGKVSATTFSGEQLPYQDDLANVVLVPEPGGVDLQGAWRITAPYGVLICPEGAADVLRRAVGDGGAIGIRSGYAVAKKAYPAQMDEWPQKGRDAANSWVSRDQIVGPIRSIQWTAEPTWAFTRVTNVVTGNGRTFHVHPDSDPPLLIARDAFNGTELWRRPAALHGLDTPCLIAVGDMLYVGVAETGRLAAFDAATGETIKEFDFDWRGVSYHNGCFIVSSQVNHRSPEHLLEVRSAETCEVLWKLDSRARIGRLKFLVQYFGTQPPYVTVGEDSLAVTTGDKLSCRDLRTGKVSWEVPLRDSTEGLISSKAGLVLTFGEMPPAMDPEKAKWKRVLRAYRAENGDFLWEYELTGIAFKNHRQVVEYDGLLWLRNNRALVDRGRAGLWFDDAVLVALGAATGKEVKSVPVELKDGRCAPLPATTTWLMGQGATTMYNPATDEYIRSAVSRTTCAIGLIPANGLFYQAPTSCNCYEFVRSLTAFSPQPVPGINELTSEGRLVKGPAYGKVQGPAAGAADWPTFRKDFKRSASTGAALPDALAESWRAKFHNTPAQVTSAGGVLCTAVTDGHTVYGLDGADGSVRWQFSARARIDSSPTIYRGLALFGSRDGYVYCLDAQTGELVWQFAATPADRRMMANGQPESLWPTAGSVLVDEDGTAYVAAGRITEANGGLFLWALDAATGAVKWRNRREPIVLHDRDDWTAGRPFLNKLLIDRDDETFILDLAYISKKDGSVTGRFNAKDNKNTAGSHIYPGHLDFFDDTNRTEAYGLAAPRILWQKDRIYGQNLAFDEEWTYGTVFTYGWCLNQFGAVRLGRFDEGPRGERTWYNLVFGVKDKDEHWYRELPLGESCMAMAWAGERLYVTTTAGEGRGKLLTLSREGKMLAETPFEGEPVYNGLSVADGVLYICAQNEIIAFGGHR